METISRQPIDLTKMKQILQNLKNGVTTLEDIPAPALVPGSLLIRTTRSLISAGTERMLVDFGKANMLDKARQQPDKVRQVLDKAKTDGVMPTINAVRNKLDQPLPLGYCNVGIVLAVGAGVTGFSIGDRVVSNGKHAEVVRVPANLCARIPDEVSDDAAAFTVIGAIALQGIRLVAPTIGETVVVAGLGLIGLLTAQLLRANGCRVLGLDFDPSRLALARQCGAEVVDLSTGADPVAAALAYSRGRGVDAVLICASTKSNDPVHQAALMCRKRGRIVLVGVTGLELSRADFFEKELSFQVSCSYGPGRYDPQYEDKGFDYPIGFVRWTEQRNFEAVLDTMATGGLNISPLVSHHFPFDNAESAYQLLGSNEPSLGILLDYPTREEVPDNAVLKTTIELRKPSGGPGTPSSASVAFIGAGNYALQALIPAFKDAGAALRTVVSVAGVSGVHAGKKYGFETTTTDVDSVFSDNSTDTVVISTRHDSHAKYVCRALNAGKHVFVEKPLALTESELQEIQATYEQARRPSGEKPILMVGYNRRFSPQVQKMKSLLTAISEPKSFVYTVNAGAIPPEHWTQDLQAGGGRIIGEGCHFVDLLRFLAGQPITSHSAFPLGPSASLRIADDKSVLVLRFADGSVGTVLYLANGHKSFPKERIEVFAAGAVLQLDNFRKLTGFGWPSFSNMNLWRQDKGNAACASAFVQAVKQGLPSPISFDELYETTAVSIKLAAEARQ